MYKMWNRNIDDKCEVIQYDDDWNRLGKLIVTHEEAGKLQGEWVSPMQVYSATKGTMGFVTETEAV